ncbi:MAG: SusF/SusE family outer membrane protein [Bacteroidales bacterium]|nr:SusF/SusE family outer membrane protein [Bacteroidales bacterium]
MKKIFYFLSALALMAGFVACEEKEEGGIDFSEIVLDGFYVYGDATGSDKVVSANAMAAGYNEAVEGKPLRPGMYEKYIWLEADKEFALIENSAGNMTFYGANLAEVNYGYDENDPNCKNFADNPNMKIQQGKLIIGEDAPKMKVKEEGLYHIVLDNNTQGDLADGAQIIVQKANWGVRGGMNGWGYTAGEMTKNEDGSITYTWADQDLAANGEFKFASCHGWKINLDVDGKVKAEVGLGLLEGKLHHTGANIVAGEKAGLYKITLTYKAKAGNLADSFTYAVELTKESTLPTECFMTGTAFGNWTWGSEGIVSLIPVHSHGGHFWTVRQLNANEGVKLSTINVANDWSKAFGKMTNGTGYTNDKDDNLVVAESGLYMIYVNFVDNALIVEPAKIYGMGPVFTASGDSWTGGAAAFTIADNLASITVDNAGSLRQYAAAPTGVTGVEWWQMEFNIYDGKIVYRAGGGDQEAVAVNAGQTVTLDFNAGTGSIK